MSYSNTEKELSQTQILKKIQKLRQDITSAEDYLKLEKSANKLTKLMGIVATYPDRKVKKELKGMGDVCEGLIRQKTRYFKKKVLNQLGSPRVKEEEKEKTLKYSKSVENFQMIPEKPQKQRRQLTKTDQEELWANRTEVRKHSPQRLEELVDSLRQQLDVYKTKITLLERQKPLNNLTLKLAQQQTVFDHDLGLKLKERGHQLQELKGRLKYYQQTNLQLRNRLSNEQKRQQDYISSLKTHISKLTHEIQIIGRQNRKLQDDLSRQVIVNGELQAQIQKISQESQYLYRQKRQRQQSEVLKMKDSGMRKELMVLSQQEKYIREMEGIIQGEQEEKVVLKEQIEALKKREKSYHDQIELLERQKDKIIEMMQIDRQQIQSLKKELAIALQVSNRTEDEVLMLKQQLVRLEQQKQKEKLQKNLQLKKKAQHLKQIKQMLQGR